MENESLAEGPELAAQLATFAGNTGDGAGVLPWAAWLSGQDGRRLRGELAVVLEEPALTGEPLDWREIRSILLDYAELAGWTGPLVAGAPPDPPGPYRVDVRDRERRDLEHASPAVQRAARELLDEVLPRHPTDLRRLPSGRVKKIGNRGVWQVDLPDGYRLRYFVEEGARTVRVTYLGAHPDGQDVGREEAAAARAQRRRLGHPDASTGFLRRPPT